MHIICLRIFFVRKYIVLSHYCYALKLSFKILLSQHVRFWEFSVDNCSIYLMEFNTLRRERCSSLWGAVFVGTDAPWWRHRGVWVTWSMTSRVDQSVGVGDVSVSDVSFAHHVRLYHAVLRHPAIAQFAITINSNVCPHIRVPNMLMRNPMHEVIGIFNSEARY